MIVGLMIWGIAMWLLNIDWLKPPLPKHIQEEIERNKWRP